MSNTKALKEAEEAAEGGSEEDQIRKPSQPE